MLANGSDWPQSAQSRTLICNAGCVYVPLGAEEEGAARERVDVVPMSMLRGNSAASPR